MPIRMHIMHTAVMPTQLGLQRHNHTTLAGKVNTGPKLYSEVEHAPCPLGISEQRLQPGNRTGH